MSSGQRLFVKITRESLPQVRDKYPFIYLGTNAKNRRAIKAYKKLGFAKVGSRHFMVGDQDNLDVVLARELHVP